MKHPCFRQPDSILEKLREFHHRHQTEVDRLLSDLETTVGQLPYNTCSHEAEIVAHVLKEHTKRRRGVTTIGELLPAVLARLEIVTKHKKNGDREDPHVPVEDRNLRILEKPPSRWAEERAY